MIKKITIHASLKEGTDEVLINTDKSKDMFESFELLGVYEFIKKELGESFATVLLMKIGYSEKGLAIQHKILRKNKGFQIKDICDKMINNEMKNIHKRIQIKKEGSKF